MKYVIDIIVLAWNLLIRSPPYIWRDIKRIIWGDDKDR